MVADRYNPDEIVRKGRERYEAGVRALVESRHAGKFLALDIETGEYEIDSTDVVAIQRVKAKHPGAVLFVLRIGQPAAYRLGGQRSRS